MKSHSEFSREELKKNEQDIPDIDHFLSAGSGGSHQQAVESSDRTDCSDEPALFWSQDRKRFSVTSSDVPVWGSLS